MDVLEIDPALFGFCGPEAPVYDGLRRSDRVGGDGLSGEDAVLEAAARRVVLDLKAKQEGSAADELSGMLSVMTRELREQLQAFQTLRVNAGQALRQNAGPVEGGDADRKQQQADAKAGIEAMSLIVRTLEKIDSLQRTIAHERERQAHDVLDEDGRKALVARFEARLDQIAERRANAIVAAREKALRSGGSEAAGGDEAAATGPPQQCAD